jgi:hypothetical protein
VEETRKRDAYQAALPVLGPLASLDIKSDVGHELARELKGVQWLKLGSPVAIPKRTILGKEREGPNSSQFGNTLELSDTSFNYGQVLPEMLPSRPEHFYLAVVFTQKIQWNYVLDFRYQIFSKDDGIAVFRNRGLFICHGTSDEGWVPWWSAHDGQRVRLAYAKGVHALAQLIAYDLGVRQSLDGNLSFQRSGTGELTAQCSEGWSN